MKKLFVTATDTDAGKTYVSRIIARALVENEYSVAVYKPISAGCEVINNELVNEDAALLLKESNTQQRLIEVNPIAFEPAIAPHIAAATADRIITIEEIIAGYHVNIAKKPDIILSEGAGGWRLPIGNHQYLSEFVQQTSQNVLLVVNIKLGCLNHAVLTHEAIIADGLNCVGWVANCQQDMPFQQENINELSQLLPIPKLAEFNYEKDISIAVKNLNLTLLLSLLS